MRHEDRALIRAIALACGEPCGDIDIHHPFQQLHAIVGADVASRTSAK